MTPVTLINYETNLVYRAVPVLNSLLSLTLSLGDYLAMNKMRGWNCAELGRSKRKRKRGEVEMSRRCINKNPFRPGA